MPSSTGITLMRATSLSCTYNPLLDRIWYMQRITEALIVFVWYLPINVFAAVALMFYFTVCAGSNPFIEAGNQRQTDGKPPVRTAEKKNVFPPCGTSLFGVCLYFK